MKPTLQNHVYFFVAIIVATFLLHACRKNGNALSPNAKFTGCRISQIVGSGADTSAKTTYTFSYNDDGSVSTIKFHTQPMGDYFVKSFVYKGNVIIVNVTDNSSRSAKDSLILDDQKRVTYIDHYSYNGSPTPNKIYEQYFYDSLGNLTTIVFHSYLTVSSQNFQWANGDIVWNTFTTGYYNYVYDTGVYNVGNITARIEDFENYGRGIYTPRHLFSMAILNTTDTTNYKYTRDAEGKLTWVERIYTGNYINTRAITYNCE